MPFIVLGNSDTGFFDITGNPITPEEISEIVEETEILVTPETFIHEVEKQNEENQRIKEQVKQELQENKRQQLAKVTDEIKDILSTPIQNEIATFSRVINAQQKVVQDNVNKSIVTGAVLGFSALVYYIIKR